MSGEEIERVEDIANDIVLQNSPVTTRLMALDDARRFRRAGVVRREIRRRGPCRRHGRGRRQHAGLVGRTVRRHACAGAPAISASFRWSATAAWRPASAGSKRSPATAPGTNSTNSRPISRDRGRIAGADSRICRRAPRPLLEDRKKLERELSDAKKKLAMGGGWRVSGGKSDGANGVRTVGDVKLMSRAVEGIELKDLRSLADEGKKRSAPASSRLSAFPATARPASWSASPTIWSPLQCRRTGPQGRRGARRQRRRRPARHGASRRPGRLEGRAPRSKRSRPRIGAPP